MNTDFSVMLKWYMRNTEKEQQENKYTYFNLALNCDRDVCM